MRGKDTDKIADVLRSRITPAYAGKSSKCSSWVTLAGDHPRLCGEKDTHIFSRSCLKGSPPPMRGKDMDEVDNVIYPGITPAYAGKR